MPSKYLSKNKSVLMRRGSGKMAFFCY